MQIVVTGVSHASAPLSVRERLVVPETHVSEELSRLREAADECILLSTCNRTEIYVQCGHEASGAKLARDWMAARSGLPRAELERHTYVHAHERAVRHALRVASGLDSMVVGEDQVLGQMRRAIAAARNAGTLGFLLDRLGSAALACGKRVRAALNSGQAPSVVSVAVAAAEEVRGSLAGARVVVIGSGETAALAVATVLARSPARMTVVNRTKESAAALALEHGVSFAVWQELPQLLADADLILGCTSAPHPVLTAEMLADARAGGNGAPCICVDLGVPRDIDPQVAALGGVHLIDIDRVGLAAQQIGDDRRGQIELAETIVVDEVERFMAWWRERDVVPAIVRLREYARGIEEAELNRAFARQPDLTEQQREVIRSLASRITAKLLHEPTVALKRDPEGANMAAILTRLYGRALSRETAAEPDEEIPAVQEVTSTVSED